MRKNKKRGSHQTIFLAVLIGLLLFSAVGFLIFSNLRIAQKRAELSTKIENLEGEIQTLKLRKAQLEAGISQTETNDYWEGKVREQGYKKSGEEQIVIVPQGEGEIQEKQEKNFWQKFLDKFGF